MIFSGVDDRNQRMEICELKQSEHPFYLATQYHPEFKTVVGRPSPPFYGFILAASGQFRGVGKSMEDVDKFRDLLSPSGKNKRGMSSGSSGGAASKKLRQS